MKKFLFSLILFISSFVYTYSQVANPVKWQFDSKIVSQNSVEITATATIDANYHMYGAYFAEGGPISTTFHFNPSSEYELDGKIIEVTPPEKKRDTSFDMDITMHNRKAIFTQKIALKKNGLTEIKGSVEWMACTDKNCLPPTQYEFVLKVDNSKNISNKKIEANKPDTIEVNQSVSEQITQVSKDTLQNIDLNEKKEPVKSSNKSLLFFFLISLLAGLAGTITPCVFPMIPMTVSFFLRGSENKAHGIFKGFVFGLSIIAIYTLIGLLVSLTGLGSNFANQLSSHWIPNTLFFLLFIVFSASFFGMFEIVLPGSIVNKADQQADKGGYLGIIFMALATVLVSFSCTGPIIGALLVEAAGGLALKPIIGMFGFGLAFAIPFTFFAIFPTKLKSLPKSGGWLNSVKIVLGMVMLAFSLKFIVNIDQTYSFNLLSREVFLGIWIVLAIILGFYILGKIQFQHDSEVKSITFPRLILSIISFTFALYLATGFNGATLSTVASILPPAKSENNSKVATVIENHLCGIPKYSDFLYFPYGMQGYFELNEGLACAAKQNKPVLIDFKGHSCSNCKIMEASVWSDKDIQRLLNNEYVLIALYTDDRTELPNSEQIISSVDGKKKQTIGQINADIQISKYKSNALPYYVITNSKGQSIIEPIGFENNVETFKAFLENGLKEFHKLK